jgi:hypothetical protein
MQLDALLRSLKKNFVEYDSSYVSVIWKGDRGFKGGYTKIKNKFPEVNMISEDTVNFKQQTIGCIDEEQSYTMFLVDDILFKMPFSERDSQFKSLGFLNMVLCVSLRLDKNISVCYATNKPQKVPPASDKLPMWKWTDFPDGDWGYPMSLDGNVYETKIIKKIIRGLEFNHPNELESKMHMFAVANVSILPKHMTCYYDRSRLFNVPANRVQEVAKNRVENSYDVVDLNNKYMKEKLVIDISQLDAIKNNSCHHPLQYDFVDEDH